MLNDIFTQHFQTFAIPGSIFLSIVSGYLFSFPVALLLVSTICIQILLQTRNISESHISDLPLHITPNFIGLPMLSDWSIILLPIELSSWTAIGSKIRARSSSTMGYESRAAK